MNIDAKNLNKWDKITVNETTDKGLISRIYKQFLQLSIKKRNSPINIWAEDLNRHFFKEDIQMANRHMKRCSLLLIIREMQIKTTIRYHLKPSEWPSSKKSTNNKCRQRCGEKETSCTVGGNIN